LDIKKIAFKEIIPFNGLPALFVPALDATIISDLHLGYEDELYKEGILLARTQLEELQKKLDQVYNTIKTKRLIINGDIRHGFGKITKSQRLELERFIFHALGYYEKILAIRGNHDNYLKSILRDLGIEFLDFYWEKEILILHGHRENDLVKKSRIIILGHEHPALILKDENGQSSKFFAFIFLPTKLKNILVLMPPFSKFAGGNTITLNRDNFLSTIAKKYAIIEEGIPFIIHEEIGTIELPKISLLSYS